MIPPTAYNQDYYDVAFGGFNDPVFRRRWARACALLGGYGDLSSDAALEFGAGLGQNLAEIKAAEKWAVDISVTSAQIIQVARSLFDTLISSFR